MTSPHFTARRYEVVHSTRYTYENVVSASYGRACLRPRDTANQRVLTHDIDVSPQPYVLSEHVDAFGNFSHYVEVLTAHTELVVRKRSTLATDWTELDLDELNRWSVGSAREALRTAEGVDPVERVSFELPSPLAAPSPAVLDYAKAHLWDERPLGDAILGLTTGIFADFRYTKGATNVRTTLEEVIETREGVCQDFAHLAVAAWRTFGLPARYVSGYIETYPPPGQQKLAGSDATHAWVSVMAPTADGGSRWIDGDPTNNHLADSRYIVTAFGRDFRDVSPLKGVIFTEGGSSTLKVEVDVIRLPD